MQPLLYVAFVSQKSGILVTRQMSEMTGIATGARGAIVVDCLSHSQHSCRPPTSARWAASTTPDDVKFVAGDRAQIGVIYNPATDELYCAQTGAGAFVNGVPIRVRQADSLADGLTGVGCSPRTTPEHLADIMLNLLQGGGMYQRTGSGALNLAYVAAGKHIGYVETHIHAWDCLAAVCLIEEAGGRVSDFVTEFGVQGAGPLVAGSPGVFDQLMHLMPVPVRES